MHTKLCILAVHNVPSIPSTAETAGGFVGACTINHTSPGCKHASTAEPLHIKTVLNVHFPMQFQIGLQ